MGGRGTSDPNLPPPHYQPFRAFIISRVLLGCIDLHPDRERASTHPSSALLGSIASQLIHADLRLPIHTTPTNDAGQGGWTPEGGCPADGAEGAQIVPLERNGQTINLQQRKFHISIPFLTSTAGYVTNPASSASFSR